MLLIFLIFQSFSISKSRSTSTCQSQLNEIELFRIHANSSVLIPSREDRSYIEGCFEFSSFSVKLYQVLTGSIQAALLCLVFILAVDDCLKDMSHPSDNSNLFLLLFLCSSMQHANVWLE